MNDLAGLSFVFGDDIIDPLSRLSRHQGTCTGDANWSASFGYGPDAIVPRGAPEPLSAPVPRLTTSRFADLGVQHAGFVGLFRLEQSIEPLLELGVRDAQDLQRLRQIKADARYIAAFDSMLERLRRCLDIEGPARALNLTMKPAGLPTVTINDDTGRRVGLHVDSWDRGTAPHRGLARNRVNLNFGREPRHFLLVDASLVETARQAGRGFDDYDRTAALARELLESRPNLEILRMRVDPGDGYIAPTDNIIHDATTLGIRHMDVSLSVLGRIAPRRDDTVRVARFGCNGGN